MQHRFVILAEISLDSPLWLDDFRRKYDDAWQFHITLKNPSLADGSVKERLQEEFRDFFKDTKEIPVLFNEYSKNRTPKGWSLMIGTPQVGELTDLQKRVSQHFSQFWDHAAPHYAEFERNFYPHITIGRHLDDDTMVLAESELADQVLSFAGRISSISLCVHEGTGSSDPKEQIRLVLWR